VKQKQQQKLWEKQERKLREMKSKGVSKENAEKAQLKAKAREPGMLCRIRQHQNQHQHTPYQSSPAPLLRSHLRDIIIIPLNADTAVPLLIFYCSLSFHISC
jgi:hypothetical protein